LDIASSNILTVTNCFLLAKKGRKRHSWLGKCLLGKNPGWEKHLRQRSSLDIMF